MSGLVGQEDSVVRPAYSDSLNRSYICTNVGKITSIRSRIRSVDLYSISGFCDEDKLEENAGADWNDGRTSLSGACT